MTDTTRRTIVRGMAWTVPVIAVAATAPAFAASGSCTRIIGRWHSSRPAYYKVKPTCEGQISAVYINNIKAKPYPDKPYTDWWYITPNVNGRDRDYVVRIEFLNGPTVTQTIRFTPWNNGL